MNHRIGETLWSRVCEAELCLVSNTVVRQAVRHMKGLFEVVAEWEVQKRSVGRHQFHCGGQPALNECKVAHSQILMEVGHEPVYVDRRVVAQRGGINARPGD